MPRKKTHAEFCQQFYNILDNEFTILNEYINSTTRILIRHEKCNHEFLALPYDFLNRKVCPKCSQRYRRTNDDFIEQIKELVGEKYLVLSSFDGVNNKIRFKHNIGSCGHEFEMIPSAFLRGSRCPICVRKDKRGQYKLKYDEVKKIIEIDSNSGCILNSLEYHGYKEKLDITCCDCGESFHVSLDNFMRKKKYRCNRCHYIASGKTQADTIDLIREFVKNNSTCKLITQVYENAHQTLLFECECGNEFTTTFNKFKMRYKRQCNECTSSYGEQAISSYLKRNNVIFIYELNFDDCKDINVLLFDFAIFNKQGQLKYLIEFQGQHHYSPIRFNGIDQSIADENFKRVVRHDNMKKNYCLQKNIPLLCISYKDLSRIDSILSNLLLGGDGDVYFVS